MDIVVVEVKVLEVSKMGYEVYIGEGVPGKVENVDVLVPKEGNGGGWVWNVGDLDAL